MFTSRFTRCIAVAGIAFLAGVSASAQYHTADTTPNQVISLTELLRVIQFYNSGGLHCMDATEDGYAPGLDTEQQSCIPHDSDYIPVDWKVNLSELLRLIQFYNLRGYSLCLVEATEDGYCPNVSPYENPTAAFTASDTTGYAPRAIRFLNESEIGQGTVISWEWTFGDGGTSNEPQPIYTYESPGVYDVSLTLTTTQGTDSLTKSEYITLAATNAEGSVVVLAPDTGWTLVKQENGDFEVTEITEPKSDVIIEPADYVVGRATSEETGHLFQYLGSKRNLAEEARSKSSLIIPATTVGHATISDFVEQGSIAVYFEITEADLERSGIPLLKSTQKGVSVGLSGTPLYNAGGLRVEIVQGSLNFDLGGDFAVDLGFFKVDRVRAMLKGRLDLEATLLVSASLGFDFSKEIVLLPPVRIPVTAVVAGVPVWIEIVLEFKGGFDLDVGGSVLSTSGFLNQTELRLGAEYRDGDWYDLTRFDSRTRGKQPTLALNSYLDARLYVRPELSVTLYSTAVPYLAAEPYLDMHGDFSPPSGQVDIGMGMDAILGFSLEILNFTLADWDKSYTVWHRPLYTLYPPAPQDLEPPVITLLGNQTITVECGTPFTDPGATALDNVDGNITGSIVNGGTVNTSEPDVYTRTYDVMDSAGNPALRKTRTVTVQDTAIPVITLLGNTAMSIECGGTFNDPGATAADTCAGNLTSSITRTGTVNTAEPGEYTLHYDVSDDSGHAAGRKTRTVTVKACEGEGIAEGEGVIEGEGVAEGEGAAEGEGDDEGVAEGEGGGEGESEGEGEWLAYNGHQYKLTSASMTWTEASVEAAAEGGYLVTVNDSAENEWLVNTFGGVGVQLWLGYNDLAAEDAWVWSNGEDPLYLRWCGEEPNNQPDEDCATLIGYGPNFGCWIDYPESAIQKGIIERGTTAQEAGETATIMLPGSVPLEVVWVPAGTFMMGRYAGEQESTESEDPRHEVTISHGFWMGKYELTKQQWLSLMPTTPWSGRLHVSANQQSPAVYISWDDAQVFVSKLKEHMHMTFRLPSESEWEYACRAGHETRFYWGDDPEYSLISAYAWWIGHPVLVGEEKYPRGVGPWLPNDWGLYDMSGNAWEWCEDDWHLNYNDAPSSSGAWLDSPRGAYRVIRGGAVDSPAAHICRSANRTYSAPDSEGTNFINGFRVAR